MTFIAEQSKMGEANVDDFSIPVTSTEAIAKMVAALN
jgi:copper homeostasis protein